MGTSLDEFFTEHLPYEIGMMRASILALATRQLDGFETNAFIETFCLHARNLIEFFKRKESCDFDPRDFTVAGFKLHKRFIGDGALQRINRQISHLTKGRTADRAQKINGNERVEMLQAIEKEIDRFLQHLTPERRAMWEAVVGPTQVSSQKQADQMIGNSTSLTSSSAQLRVLRTDAAPFFRCDPT